MKITIEEFASKLAFGYDESQLKKINENIDLIKDKIDGDTKKED